MAIVRKHIYFSGQVQGEMCIRDRPVIEKKNGVLVINPGSVSFPRQEGRKPSYVILNLEEGKEPQAEIRFL